LKKYGFGTDLDALPDEVFKNLTDPSQTDYSGLRSYAKELTGVRKKLYQNGRLGMIIDGTGDDYAKISKEKKELEQKGYDCYMIFVNTTLDVALERNRNRDRVLPEKIVVDSHRQVVKNIGGFQGLFGSNNFIIIDNNKDLTQEQAQRRFNMLVKKGLSRFIKRPIQNPKGKSWVRKQKMLEENYSEKNWTRQLTERVDYRQIAKELMRRYRVNSKLEFSPRATKGDYDFDRDIIKLRPFYTSVRDFLITILHEIYHAMDSKRYGRKKFVRMYTNAGQEQEDKGLDFHDNNPFEIKAERWARREVNKYIKRFK
jgi:predicted kinase